MLARLCAIATSVEERRHASRIENSMVGGIDPGPPAFPVAGPLSRAAPARGGVKHGCPLLGRARHRMADGGAGPRAPQRGLAVADFSRRFQLRCARHRPLARSAGPEPPAARHPELHLLYFTGRAQAPRRQRGAGRALPAHRWRSGRPVQRCRAGRGARAQATGPPGRRFRAARSHQQRGAGAPAAGGGRGLRDRSGFYCAQRGDRRHGLISAMTAKVEALQRTHRKATADTYEMSKGDISSWWMLNIVSTASVLLMHAARSPGRHPESLYETMLSLAGSLMTFSDRYKAADLPPY